MKIGIVTFYKSLNYGAMLQARALNDILCAWGHSVFYIYHPHAVIRRSSFLRCFIVRPGFDFIQKIFRKMSQWVSYPITSFSDRLTTTKLCRSKEDLAEVSQGCRVLIAGSDQIWNPRWVVPNDIETVFLGFAPEGCKRISYAASFSVSEWGVRGRNEAARLLKEFDVISVREESGVRIVKEISGRNAQQALDPTLLHTRDYYERLIPGDGRAVKMEYIFKYVINGWTDNPQETHLISLCRQYFHGLSVVNETDVTFVGLRKRVDVPGWLRRIRDAKFVVTNSFHGLVFSLIFNRPFVVVALTGANAGMNERVDSLLKLLGLKSRMCGVDVSDKMLCDILAAPIDWGRVNATLVNEREKSLNFLEGALK